MLKYLFVVYCILVGTLIYAHPPIAIVIDSKGNLYYSDLEQVWKITKRVKSIAVPNVHTHQLWLDNNDNLFGEHLEYAGETINKFYHYLWVLTPNGILDTVISKRQAFVQNDYSLDRDANGIEYYIEVNDTSHIYKRLPNGKEIVHATGNFEDVTWLSVLRDGSIFYFSNNNIYKIHINVAVEAIVESICNKTPSFIHCQQPAALGTWKDETGNVYVACFSDRLIKRINLDGSISIYYTSPENWTPTNGIFDKDNNLWVLEVSDKNEVRAVETNPMIQKGSTDNSIPKFLIIGFVLIILLLSILFFRTRVTM